VSTYTDLRLLVQMIVNDDHEEAYVPVVVSHSSTAKFQQVLTSYHLLVVFLTSTTRARFIYLKKIVFSRVRLLIQLEFRPSTFGGPITVQVAFLLSMPHFYLRFSW
jgi:hypothetical protein